MKSYFTNKKTLYLFFFIILYIFFIHSLTFTYIIIQKKVI